jgi:type VI secretion system secreted protein Hcp
MALDASIKVVGSVQTTYKHQSTIKSRAGTSVVTRSEWGIDAPRDEHTGLSSGKRRHLPYTIECPADASVINYETSIVTNEVLKSVTINYYQTTANALVQGSAAGMGGEAKPYYTVLLENAVISKFEWVQPYTRAVVDADAKNKENHFLVSFAYQKITITWTDGGLTFSDDWTDAK